MKKSTLWSLRLGFSGRQASKIEALGIENFLSNSFDSKTKKTIPDFLKSEPKTLLELRAFRSKIRNGSEEEKKQAQRDQRRTAVELRAWWIDKMRTEDFPLRQKMTAFWHNHFVSTVQKVKVNHWVYQHHMILKENAFGNFRELCKKVVKSNAMVRYLDNVDNRRGKINENLSRELLELFTLGIGNYTEADIKNGAKGLAGLGIGPEGAMYRRAQMDNDKITYLGKTGNFKADELVDIIFEQRNIPYLLTEKVLKWFVYDKPTSELIQYYGDYFREVDFEMQPLLTKIFTEEYQKDNAGSKIKDPLTYVLQMADELQMYKADNMAVAFFLQQQGMDLFNQPNVKGWDGGRSWLTPQILLQRNNASDLMCRGSFINRRGRGNMNGQAQMRQQQVDIKLTWDRNLKSKEIITSLTDRLLFQVSEPLQKDLEDVLKYDFDPKSENADQVVLRLFNFITKTPEYQLI